MINCLTIMVFNFPNIDYTYIFVKYGVPPTPFSQEEDKPNTNSNQINPCAVVSKHMLDSIKQE